MLLIFVTAISCKIDSPQLSNAVKAEVKQYPSDHLFAQRSYPYGKIDHKAYKSSLTQRSLYQSKEKRYEKKWQFKGPTNICGRVTDIEMPSKDTTKIYAGTASGGISMSNDLGQSWQPIFDEAASLSIGDIAISEENNNIIYVGTGESNAGGGSIAYDGLGVYSSKDGGETWTAKGLEDVGSVGRIVIDPNDYNTVFVAAMGSLFANNVDRGVYRTKDGGNNWEQVLFKSDSTGAIDLAIHPQDGNIIFAALWERIRRPYRRQYGGATCGIYKSEDGGDTWRELTEGLPLLPTQKGRIGLTLSPSHPNIIYALYADQAGKVEGVYKSEDSGETWTAKSIEGIANVSYMWWFGRITVNPIEPDDVYVTSISMHRSTDGGDRWSGVFSDAHVDHHAMYIHPLNDDIVLNANDGGVNRAKTEDAESSILLNGISNFQFYYCKIHPDDPSIIYGGSQDNGTLVTQGDTAVWNQILGGDGFRVLVDPLDSLRIYVTAGGFFYRSIDGGQNFFIIGNGLAGVRAWAPPLLLDPDVSSTMYTGTDRLFRSEDYGSTWAPVSPFLVRPDRPMGNLNFGTLSTVDVSSLDNSVIYVGTDDGQVWITRDRGGDWTLITDGLPLRWVTSVHHDPHDISGVYLTVSGFRFGESTAQVFHSDDYGNTWDAIGAGLPDIPVNEILPDPLLPDVLYVATDIGVFVTENQGVAWRLLGSDLPTVPILDLDIHAASRTMAIATYGRGIYTYDLPDNPSVTNEMKQVVVNIFPNPTSDVITIETEQVLSGLSVWDRAGNRVGLVAPRVVDRGYSCSVEHLLAGQYFVKYKEGYVGSFIKQ